MSISTTALSADEKTNKNMLVGNGVLQHMELLTSVDDLHGGVTVDMKHPMDCKVFASMLKASLSYWKQQVISYFN